MKVKERNLLKLFNIEKPKKDQLFRIMWVEKDGNHLGMARPLKEAEDLLSKVLSARYYSHPKPKIFSSNTQFDDCKSTTELRNSYIIPVED